MLGLPGLLLFTHYINLVRARLESKVPRDWQSPSQHGGRGRKEGEVISKQASQSSGTGLSSSSADVRLGTPGEVVPLKPQGFGVWNEGVNGASLWSL